MANIDPSRFLCFVFRVKKMGGTQDMTSTPNSSSSASKSPLKCEKELIPVLAGECRANPITIPIEKSLIRSASAEVTKK